MTTRGRARRKPIDQSRSGTAAPAVVLTRSRSLTRSQTRAEPLPNQLIQPQPSAGPKLVWPNTPDLPNLPETDPSLGCSSPMPSSISPVQVEESRPLKISKSEVLTPVQTPSVSQSVSQSSLAESLCSLRHGFKLDGDFSQPNSSSKFENPFQRYCPANS